LGEQVLDLPRPEGLVHEHGDGADRQRGEERGGRVAATLQEDRDGIVGRGRRPSVGRRDRRDALPERRIAHALLALRPTAGRAPSTLGAARHNSDAMLLLALSHDPTAGDKRLLSCDRVVSRLCNEHNHPAAASPIRCTRHVVLMRPPLRTCYTRPAGADPAASH